MFTLVPLLDASASLDALSTGLLAHLQASGMPLPEDECFLDYITAAVRYGRTRAWLAVHDGQAIGVVAWHHDNHIGHIALLYTLPQAPAAVARELLAQAMAALQEQDVADGIYAELPDAPLAVRQALDEAGFVGAERLIMRAELAGESVPVEVPPGYRLIGWQDDYCDAVAEVIYRANAGTLDAQIIPELRTLASTARIVWQTLDGRYGRFDRKASGLALAEGEGVVGVTLTTGRISGQGFTAEICVLPAHRRRGLARALMGRAHAIFYAEGRREAMLGVTEGNPARHLYESLGYVPVGSVWTYAWPKPDSWLGRG